MTRLRFQNYLCLGAVVDSGQPGLDDFLGFGKDLGRRSRRFSDGQIGEAVEEGGLVVSQNDEALAALAGTRCAAQPVDILRLLHGQAQLRNNVPQSFFNLMSSCVLTSLLRWLQRGHHSAQSDMQSNMATFCVPPGSMSLAHLCALATGQCC